MKRQRKLKRWTQCEISKIIDYMEEFGNIEKPTARSYYENMLKIYPIDATWDLIKWKVRYLRVIYVKTVQWLQSNETQQMNNALMEERLMKMCPHYYRLNKIFGENRAEIVEIMDSNDSFGDYSYEDLEDTVDYHGDVKVFDDYNQNTNYGHEGTEAQLNNTNQTNGGAVGGSYADEDANEATQMSTGHHSITHPEVILHEGMSSQNGETTEVEEKQELLSDSMAEVKRLKKESLRNSLNALSQSQDARNEMQRLRLKFEEYKFAQEFAFIKEKFIAEQEHKKQELELKKREIESNEKLRIMEMEKNERIAKYELSIKYNGQNRYSSNNLHADLY